MKRSLARLLGAVTALILATGAAVPLRAEDPTVGKPASDPVDAATWAARDAEGRWALFLARNDPRPGPLELPWIDFLERQGDWQQLEWVAMATNSSKATGALAKLKNPVWVRCCVWCLGAADSHQGTSAKNQLLARPAIVRGWFALHPHAATGRAKELITELQALGSTRDMDVATKLTGPYDPEVLLAALVPPPQVAEFGERTRAEQGVTYVHQVERALQILEHSDLRGEPWAGRVAALLKHPSPAVRRAAALTAAARPWRELPVDRLIELVDAADQPPDVRSAAVLALARERPTRAHLHVLRVALDPRHPSFTAAVSSLADIDTGFLFEAWTDLNASPAGAESAEFLRAQRERLASTLKERREPDYQGKSLPGRLALAAEAELSGDPLAERLVAWTKGTLAAEKANPGVRDALGLAATRFDGNDWSADAKRADALTVRVRTMAAELLQGPSPPR